MTFDHTYASAIVGAQKNHVRKAADFYPTPPDVTTALLDFLQIDPCYIWEPACGDGAMAKVLSAAGHNVLGTDLREDSGYGEGGIDFLTYNLSPETGIPFNAVYNDWVITNPPFKHAADFIEKSLQIAPNVAMLLKSQFWHARRRYDLFQKHRPSWILPLTWRPAFLEAERGSSPLMDVIWVVWQKGVNENGAIFQPINRPKNIILPTASDLDELLG